MKFNAEKITFLRKKFQTERKNLEMKQRIFRRKIYKICKLCKCKRLGVCFDVFEARKISIFPTANFCKI